MFFLLLCACTLGTMSDSYQYQLYGCSYHNMEGKGKEKKRKLSWPPDL